MKTNEKPRRYFDGQRTKLGDLLATCRFGTCHLVAYLEKGWTGDVLNVLTRERFHVYLNECDLIERKA